MERKTIYLCLAHMSEAGLEQKYVKEAFDTNWVVPMGPNVNAFEKDLKKFVCSQTSNEELGVRRCWCRALRSVLQVILSLILVQSLCL